MSFDSDYLSSLICAADLLNMAGYRAVGLIVESMALSTGANGSSGVGTSIDGPVIVCKLSVCSESGEPLAPITY